MLYKEGGLRREKGSTDKVAMLKMTVKRIIFNFDVLSRQRIGIGFFDVRIISRRECRTYWGKNQCLLTRAKMKKSRTALTEPVETSILMMSRHLPFIGGGLSYTRGASQNRRMGVLA